MRAAPTRTRRLLSISDWLLLAEGFVTLAGASVAIRLLPFRTVAAAASRPIRARVPVDEAAVRKLRWAVEAWGRRVPWRAVCFQRGLALHWMLRRRGFASVLHYGVGTPEEKKGEGIAAHVWISVEGEIVLGGREAPNFACLASFPAAEGEGEISRLPAMP